MIDKLHTAFIKTRNNKMFEIFIIAVIIIASINIGVRTYDVHESVIDVIFIIDIIITLIFIMEIAIRIIAEDKWQDFFKSGWNVFDITIIIFSVIPLEFSEGILVVRLLRIFRVLRLISFIPELRNLIDSLFASLQKISYITLLMFIIFYIYANAGSLMFSHINYELWGNMHNSLLTLFRIITFEDWTDIMYETLKVYPSSWIYYITFIFLIAFIFLNMMIGAILNQMSKDTNDDVEDKLDKILSKLDKK